MNKKPENKIPAKKEKRMLKDEELNKQSGGKHGGGGTNKAGSLGQNQDTA